MARTPPKKAAAKNGVTDFLARIKRDKAEFVDFRFTDTLGKNHHITVPAANVDAELLIEGKQFDGSSIAGWRGIENSDMKLVPDFESAVMDPFVETAGRTLIVVCDVYDPVLNSGYNRDPRSIAKRATEYLKKTGVGDSAMFGPEPEFFIFDSVEWKTDMHYSFVRVRSSEAEWASAEKMDGANPGHRPGIKGGYFPVAPVDSLVEIRNEICRKLAEVGIPPEVHHHEVATAGQCEIGAAGGPAVRRGDISQMFKYIVHNVAHEFGKTATFMPKPLSDDNGSGMHIHQSIAKNGKPLFAGDKYAGLSNEALWYVGGILKHARALNAIANPTTNSYKRLLPGFEAPTRLAYSARNRSAAIRIPFTHSPKGRRIETRFPDPMANPYLVFSAMLLAGLDGILKKISPGDPTDFNLYEMRRSRDKVKIPSLCNSLPEALAALDSDRDFLKAGGVFDDDAIWSEVEAFVFGAACRLPCPSNSRCITVGERGRRRAPNPAAVLQSAPNLPIANVENLPNHQKTPPARAARFAFEYQNQARVPPELAQKTVLARIRKAFRHFARFGARLAHHR